jgi:hypothetical protein
MKQITTLRKQDTWEFMGSEITRAQHIKMLSGDQKPSKMYRYNISIQEKNIYYTLHLMKLKHEPSQRKRKTKLTPLK